MSTLKIQSKDHSVKPMSINIPNYVHPNLMTKCCLLSLRDHLMRAATFNPVQGDSHVCETCGAEVEYDHGLWKIADIPPFRANG